MSIMTTYTARVAVCCLAILLTSITALARDAARDLRKMKGFTIIDAATVSQIITTTLGDKIVKLDNGTAYRVQFLLLDPLTLTDVIVFAKPPPKELREKTDKKIPDAALSQIKLLIDNEAYDASPVRLD
jgi:hypothetical protein